MDQDIYAPPKSEVLEVKEEDVGHLASRWNRFLASIIDGITILIVTMPTMYFTGGFETISQGTQPSFTYPLLLGLLGLIVFMIINTKLLINKGQTIGKRILKIKIVNHEDGDKAPKKQLLIRYLTYFIPGQVPLIGQLFSIVNILFIFGAQRRCVHDFVAKTKVVKC